MSFTSKLISTGKSLTKSNSLTNVNLVKGENYNKRPNFSQTWEEDFGSTKWVLYSGISWLTILYQD